MGRTHAELLASISASELAWWEAFQRVDGPIGQRRDDILAAWVAMHIIAPHRDPDKGPVKLADFLIDYDPPAPVEDEEAIPQWRTLS